MANLYDKASLVLPTSPAYKDGAIQAYKPLTSQGTFDFTRGSNLAATRVDVNGLIEKGRENLLLQSNNFNTTWSKPNSTLTQGFSGYDGSNDAWKWSSSVAGTIQLSQATGVAGMQTLSIYAKAGSRDVFSIWVGTGIDFNLTTGQAAGHANASMESVGNGWWRCSYFNIYATLNPYFVASAAGEFIYIMNAQGEQGLVATDYIETGASTAQAGILEDMPRLDYSGGASCPALLLEPQRTNLITHSEYFSDNSWTKLGSGTASTAIVTSNYATSPDGLRNASRLQCNLNGGTTISDQSLIYDTITGTGDTSAFVYVKSNTGSNQTFYLANTLNDRISAVATTEWQKFELKWNAVGNGRSLSIGSRGTTGSDDTLDLLIWGAQVEAASYPTSYIPTYGSSVTRSGDVCIDAGDADTFNDSEGVLFAEMSALSDDSTNRVITISDGTTSNRVQIYFNSSNGITVGVAGQAAISYSTDIQKNLKVAFKYKTNDFALWVNGVEVGTDSLGSAPSGLQEIDFHNGASGSNFYGNMKQIIYFPTALTDTELASLTTL